MAIELSNDDHKKLDELLGKVLDAYQGGAVSRDAAIGAIAHLVAAAAQDNDGEVKSWVQKPEVYERWKKGVGKA